MPSNSVGSAPSAPRKRSARPVLLLSTLVMLVFFGWLLDAPGIWLRYLAEQSLRKHDPTAALTWIQRAVLYSPKKANSGLLGVRAMLQLNRVAAAQEWLERTAEMGAPIDLQPLRVVIAAQRGDMTAAEKLMNWTDATPLPLEAYEAIVRCAQYNNQIEKADLFLNQLEQTGAVPSIVAYQRGRNLELSENFTAAAIEYSKAFELQPAMARAAFRAGFCRYKLREFPQALSLFDQVKNGPYATIADIEIANCLWETNRLDEAVRRIQTSINISPEQVQAMYLQLDEYVDIDRAALVAARIADAQGNAARTLDLVNRVLAHNYREFEARALQIKSLKLLNRTQEANEMAKLQSEMIVNRQRCGQLRLELEAKPDDIDKLCELAELYWKSESEAESRLTIVEILKLDPNCVRAHSLLGKIKANGNQPSP